MFRTRLRAIMVDRGITQRELAKQAEIAYPYVNRLLQGLQVPRIDVVEKLASALKVPMSDFFN